MAEKKRTFAPIPARAMLDSRLKERHWRTLAVIAAHDRFGKNGIGCYASHERLAEMIGCDYSRLSTNLTELGEMGYIERRVHPLNKRLRVYRVIYSDDDLKAIKEARKSLQDRKVSPPDSLPEQQPQTADGLPDESANTAEYREKPSVNIFRETEKRSCGNKERNSAEAAPPDGGAVCNEDDSPQSMATYLRRLEVSIKQDKPMPEECAFNHFDNINYILESTDKGEPLHEWAARLEDDLLYLQSEGKSQDV